MYRRHQHGPHVERIVEKLFCNVHGLVCVYILSDAAECGNLFIAYLHSILYAYGVVLALCPGYEVMS